MAKSNFLVDIDLNNNQLLNATLQNLSVHPSVAPGTPRVPGFVYWNTTAKTAYVFTGKPTPDEWLDLGDLYTHPTTGVLNPTLTGANVLATLSVNAQGHVTAATTRQLTLAELGFTGDANANNYIHPTFTGNTLPGALTGAMVISNIVVNNQGHVTSFSTRALTAGDIGASSNGHTHTLSDITDVTASAAQVNLLNLAGLTPGWVLRATSATTAAWGKLLGSEITNDLNWVKIADSLTNTTDTWSSSKIQSLIDDINSAVSGGLINKGGYDAATNTPKLDVTPIAGIKNGWTYVVTVAGQFFTENLQIGDMIIAKQDTPTTLAHWTTVNKNIPDIVDASLTEKGIIQLGTATEVQTGTDALKAVTPSTLSARTATTTRTGILALATALEAIAGTDAVKAITPATLKSVLDDRTGGFSALIGNGTLKTFNITHGLNTTDVVAQVIEVSSGETVTMQISRTSTTVVNVQCNSIPILNQYKVIIKK